MWPSTYRVGIRIVYKNTNLLHIHFSKSKTWADIATPKSHGTFLLLFIYLPDLKFFLPDFGWKHPRFPDSKKFSKFSLIGGNPLTFVWNSRTFPVCSKFPDFFTDCAKCLPSCPGIASPSGNPDFFVLLWVQFVLRLLSEFWANGQAWSQSKHFLSYQFGRIPSIPDKYLASMFRFFPRRSEGEDYFQHSLSAERWYLVNSIISLLERQFLPGKYYSKEVIPFLIITKLSTLKLASTIHPRTDFLLRSPDLLGL